MYYVITGMLGALMAIMLAMLSRSQSFYILAGLAPLFPIFTMFAHILAYRAGGIEQLKPVMIFGVYSIFCYLAYLGTLYVGIYFYKVKLIHAIPISLIVWFCSAFLIYYYRGRNGV